MIRDKQNRGSEKPVPGKCGAKLAGSNPPRYCTQNPAVGGNGRCARFHNGRALAGPAHHQWKDGRSSKYFGVMPKNLAKHFDNSRLESIASCREEIALVDARTKEVLEQISAANPTGFATSARVQLGLLRIALEDEDAEAAMEASASLDRLLSEQAAVSSGWEEIHRLLPLRAKLSQNEQGYQEMLGKRILVEQVDAFMKAVIANVKMLTDDRKKQSEFALRVMEMGRGVVAPALMSVNEAMDAEIVEEENGGKG